MRRIFAVLCMLLTLSIAVADGPDDLYLQLYNTLQLADAANENGQYRAAADKYSEVKTGLEKFQNTYPNWNPKIVSYRLKYISERVQSLQQFLAVAPAPSGNFQVSSAKTTNAGKSDDSEAQINSLANEIRRLESEKSNLEAKLREAFSVRPDQAESTQLSKAEEKIASLEKERDLLKVALQQARVDASVSENSAPADPRRMKQLEQERDDLQKKLDLALKQQALQESRYKNEIKQAQAKLKQLEQIERDRADVEKKLRLALEDASDGKVSKSELKKIKKLESEKAELQEKFNAASTEVVALQAQRESEIRAYQSALDRIKELERERDNLQKRLAKDDAVSPEKQAQIARENMQLRSRLEAYEARPTPLTAEELALFKKPEKPAAPKSLVVATKMTKELPSKARSLVAEADKAFAEQRFEDAEKKYEQVLNQNGKNVYTLANLASTKLELNRVGEAEETLKRALELDGDDAFSLLLLGKIKMSQDKFDEALDLLSRSAQINPQSAEAQNYLGIVLSEKGQRVSAEAALRKAIQIQPDYASAHHNLAIIYATQKPPFIELARWHYDKAVSLGHSKNPELEKLMAGN